MGDRRILPDESRPSASSADALSASGHASHAQENHESGISRPTEIERALEAADAYGHGTGAPVDESAPVDNAKLRRSAEERLRDSPRTQELNGLEHELRVQQAELEIQNEELREVEQSLEVSRQEFFALYDLAPVGYLTIDEQGLIKRANFTAAELLSADRIRLAGRPLSSYLAEGQTRTFFDHIANVLGAKQSVSCELAFKSQKNNVFFARVTSSPAPPSMSAGAEVFLTIVDISDRILAEEALRDREQRLRAIVDYAPLAIALLDTDDRIIECNEVFERFVERRSDELLHSEFTDFVVDPDLRAFRSMLASGGKSVQPEIRLHPRAREVRAWMTPVDGTRGSGARRLLLMEDISERNRAVERADFLERELVSVHQEKLQALGQLAGGVAHDFNNMLAAIMAFAECALLTDDLPEIIVEDLTGIRDASLRARNLVREVLTFARKRHPVRARVELDKYLQSALGLVRGAAPSHVHFHYEGEPGAAVFIDEGQIEQAIVNVLTNSVQAIGPEEGSIHISVRQTELVDVTQSDGGVADSGSFWCIVIRDDGPGIDADVLSHIFEPFYTTRESSGGCGMGLATCQSVVELHGGILEVSSEQNLGAEFRMFLPAHRQDSSSALLPPPVPERFEGSILLVDDEELVLRASQRLLIGLGARVEACSSPADALERVQAAPGQYDVVITDLTMPELLGTQLAEKINRVAPNLPILLLTGNRGRIDPESLERVKLVGIIEKPLSLRETSEALGRLIPVNQDSPATSD